MLGSTLMGAFVAAVVALGLAGSNGVAPARQTVAAVPLQVEGELGEDWQRRLAEGVLEGLSRGNFDVLAPADLVALAPDVATCSDAACWARVAAAADARYLVRTVVRVQEARDYTVRVALLDGRTGAVVAEVSEPCQVCGMQEVRELVADESATLRKKLDDLVRGSPVLVVSSTPEPARVLVDGELIGETPLRREVTEGRHVARAEKEGFVPMEREFLAVAGVEETLAFRLDPLPDTRRRHRPWGWASLGVGLATLVPGITFLALDERPAPGDRCTGANVDPSGNCRYRYDTLVPGIALTVAGAVITSVGVAVLVATRRKRGQRKPRATASLAGVRF
jgi:TolB-like protein